MSSSSSSRNWLFDVFVSFRGEDVRKNFLSHFLKELDRKLMSAFKDNEIEKSESLDPVLNQAIKDSRIAIVLFSENYASSSWCLNELLEIVKCKDDYGQIVIPVFYRLDPSHVRKQTGHFGEIFEKTCKEKTEDEIRVWRKALKDVADLVGYDSKNWENEAKLIDDIVSDVLKKLNLTPSKDFDNFVGIEDHIAEMSVMLELECKEVRAVGIWGPSGIGKTTIARALFSRLSHHFQGSIFIDTSFVSLSREIFSRSNPDDYNMKLHLQENFLSKILDKDGVKVDHLGAVRDKLKYQKVLIIIDDLDDQVVLDALAGGDEWFGPGSRIVAITKDMHILRSHGIKYVYEVGIPSKKLALQMLCHSAFKQNSPPDGYMELASEVAMRVGGLPLGLHLLGLSLRGRKTEYWEAILPTLRKGIDGKIEKALRISYEGLDRKEHKALFRYIACFFNGDEINYTKLMLADSELNVDVGLETLVDKSLIHVRPSGNKNIIDMHCLVQEVGKEIVCAQSDEPGEREFLIDSKNVCDVLEDKTGTKKVIGISLDIEDIDELRIHKKAFKGMRNLRFLNIYTNKYWNEEKEVRWHLPKGFDYLPPKLRLLRLDGYQMRCMPSNFRPENLVKLQMQWSKLEKLWEGVHSLSGLKYMNVLGSKNLKEIPDLSMAINLETLFLNSCSSLVELPSSIQHLQKLDTLNMSSCENLVTLPTGINLQSLDYLNLSGCSSLKSFPDISTNISRLYLSYSGIKEIPSNLRLKNLEILDISRTKSEKLWERVQPLRTLMTMFSPSLTEMWLSDIPSLVELPSSFQNFQKLKELWITRCINLETLPTGINLKSLYNLNLTGCSRLRSFPDISTNISVIYLTETGIEEVPWWIEKFSKLKWLFVQSCSKLRYVYLNIFKLNLLKKADFSNCGALSEARWNDSSIAVATARNEIKSEFFFTNCFNLDQEALLQQQPDFKQLIMSGEEVPSYFSHRTTGASSLAISLLQTPLSQQFFRFKACAVVDCGHIRTSLLSFNCQVGCRFINRFGKHFDSRGLSQYFSQNILGSHLLVFDCRIPVNKENASLAELNFDHVDIQLHISNICDSTFILKGWGIRLFEDCSSPENRLGNPNTLPHVCEVDEVNLVNDGCHETKQGEECGES